MMRRISLLVLMATSVLLAGCGSGMVRRVSDPAVSVQQLTVKADGQWVVELRLQNYSSIPMRFDTVKVEVRVGDQAAGTLQATPGLSVGPESATSVESRDRAGTGMASGRPLAFKALYVLFLPERGDVCDRGAA